LSQEAGRLEQKGKGLLFTSIGLDHVSELQPPAGLLSILQMIYEYGQPRWNNIDMEKLKNSEKYLSLCHFARHKSHMDWHGRELESPLQKADD
jgi:hypothetical protein